MLQNRAFWKALHSLTHPISLIAIVVLLLNDHWLRYAYPSWVFGKLGDFTWLIFAPFLVALLLAWIVPQRMKTQPNWVGWMSIGLVGVWFALAKTHPAVHSFSLDVLKFISGWQPTLLMDSSDLITLTALPISVWIWNNADDQPKNVKAWASVALGLGVLATAATSPAEADLGIFCLNLINADDYAIIPDDDIPISFTNDNYEFHWPNDETTPIGVCPPDATQYPGTWLIEMPERQIRIVSGEAIQSSTDGGTTWRTEFDLGPTSQDVRQRYADRRYDIVGQRYYFPGPLDIKIDKNNKNLVMAMGLNGILVRTPEREYTWVPVGPYYLETITEPGGVFSVLRNEELWIAIAVFFLTFASFQTQDSLTIAHKQGGLNAGLFIAWLFMFLAFWMQSANENTIFSFSKLAVYPIGLIGICSVYIGFLFAIDINRPYRTMKILFVAFLIACCFLSPYILWARGTIYSHATSTGYAAILLIMGLIAGYVYLRRGRLAPKPKKQDESQKET